VKAGDLVEVQLAEGQLECRVQNTTPKHPG